MSYIVNTNIFGTNFVPPKRRSSDMVAWVNTLLYPLQVLYDTMFGTYKDGNSASNYNNGTSYAIGDQVKYIDRAIYQCYVATTGNIPTDTNYWFKIQDLWIGVEQRMKYNAQPFVLEYALNEYFGTTFVNQLGNSEIYLTRRIYHTYVMQSSATIAYRNEDVAAQLSYEGTPIPDPIDYIINIPAYVWAALGNSTQERDGVISNYVNTFNLAGINYLILTY